MKMRRSFSYFLTAATLLSGCTLESPESPSLIFFVIGDWGERGSTEQMMVSLRMNEWAGQLQPKFIVTTGDNFYNEGVASTADSHWLESFIQVYSWPNLDSIPWYPTLGNHDYVGTPAAQVEYSSLSDRWQMPARYYTMVVVTPQSKRVRLVMTDTSPMHDFYHTYALMMNEITTQDTTLQLRWLDSVTSLNDADWKIVIGHHPVYTGGIYKEDVASVKRHLEPIFERNKVDIYFCGHEHDLQHLKPSARRTHYFISGGGSKIRPAGRVPETLFAESALGFMIVSINDRGVRVRIIESDGRQLYQAMLSK